MNGRATGWVRLQLKAAAYADFGVAPVLVPVRIDVLEVMAAPGGQLTAQMMAAEIVAWVEEHPDEYAAYRPLLGELAYSVGTELAMAGDHAGAACWLERSAIARPTDVRAVGNFARALARSGQSERALQVCSAARRMKLDAQAASFFASVEKESLAALAAGAAPLEPGDPN